MSVNRDQSAGTRAAHEANSMIDRAEMGQRVREVLTTLGMKQRHAAQKIGFRPGYMNDVLQGRTKPSLVFLSKLRVLYNVSPLWVMHGEGPVFLPVEMGEEA